jgi:hypothetical protein
MGRQIGLIPRLFGEVLVPRTVYREVVEDGAGLPGSEELRTATWARVVEVDRASIARLAGIGNERLKAACMVATSSLHPITTRR